MTSMAEWTPWRRRRHSREEEEEVTCEHVRMLYGHMRMRESVTVKVCTKYKIRISCISLEISLHVESCKPMWNLTLRY